MIELGLARISQLVKLSPLRWKAIHIAGTNGKGSVAAYLSALLSKGGVRTGRFNSPHLIDRWDCIVVDENPVQKSVFLAVEDEVKSRARDLKAGASEFELLTATAFEIFNQTKVDVGIVEVGLGGRLDATNVLPHENVILSIITKIGLDHQALLGNTLTEIATEKGGIIKPGVPCLADGTNASEVLAALEACAVKARNGDIRNTLWTTPRELGSTDTEALRKVEIDLNLEPHQKANLRLAVDALNYVQQQYPLNRPLSSAINQVPEIRWPGRLQRVSIKQLVGRDNNILLDGAHNIQSAEVLGKYVERKLRVRGEPVTWVLAMSKGKAMEDILGCLLLAGDVVISTQFGPVDGMPWVQSASAAEILSAAQTVADEKLDRQSGTAETVEKALVRAAEVARGEPLVVAGSLYLVSDVLRLLRNSPTKGEHGAEEG